MLIVNVVKKEKQVNTMGFSLSTRGAKILKIRGSSDVVRVPAHLITTSNPRQGFSSINLKYEEK